MSWCREGEDYYFLDGSFLRDRLRGVLVSIILARARNALFTAAWVGNISATSGSSNTRFVLSRKRFAYFPRVPPAKSYSPRICAAFVFLVLEAFFIFLSFVTRRDSRADDANPIVSFREGQDNRPNCDMPTSTKRASSTEWAGPSIVTECSSPNAVIASRKLTPCFRSFSRAF